MAGFLGLGNSVGSPETKIKADHSCTKFKKKLPNRRLTTPLFCKHELRSSLECEIGTAVEPFRENNSNVKPACH